MMESILGIKSDSSGKFSADQVFLILNKAMGHIDAKRDQEEFHKFIKALREQYND